MKEPADSYRDPVPWWVWLIIVILTVPGVAYPLIGLLVASSDTIIRAIAWLFPLYTLLSAFLAWQCWGRRTTLSWIILGLMLLSDLSVYYLADTMAAAMRLR